MVPHVLVIDGWEGDGSSVGNGTTDCMEVALDTVMVEELYEQVAVSLLSHAGLHQGHIAANEGIASIDVEHVLHLALTQRLGSGRADTRHLCEIHDVRVLNELLERLVSHMALRRVVVEVSVYSSHVFKLQR